MEVIYARRPDSRLERLLVRLVRNSRAGGHPAATVDFVLTGEVDISWTPGH